MDRLEDCVVSRGNGKLIPLKENQAKITFKNPSNDWIIKIKPEKCSTLTGKRCDNLVIIERSAAGIFVELKGRHYEQGLKQLQNTVKQVKTLHILDYMKAYLVTSSCPKITTKNQRDQRNWQKEICPLRIIRSGVEIDLTTII
ncbi:MAG: hypothetical protein K9N06_00100 [Candidatus Cloacimonetes bacterium]|nr:hypothetical protein [Candidatus Cloacimonadota bacterium]